MVAPSRWTTLFLGVLLPLLLIIFILTADSLEGPKTAYVGVLAVVPMLAAVFGTPTMTAFVGVVTWLSAFSFGHLASDGNVTAQTVRLLIIGVSAVLAVGAAFLRIRRERMLVAALQGAALADQMRVHAETDPLTGLRNRRGLINAVENVDFDHVRTVAIVDCDGLKTVNDGRGHQAGDEYLRAIAGRLTGSLHASDLVARWGGDEFLIVLGLGLGEAIPALRRVQAAISGTPMSVLTSMVEGSVSIGVAPWSPGETLDEALTVADRALYSAKARGGNQLVAGDRASTAPTTHSRRLA